MLVVISQVADSDFNLWRCQASGFLESLAFGQAGGRRAAGNRSPAPVGGKRSAQDAVVAKQQPKFHRVTARAGDARVGVGAFQRAETGWQ